MVRRADPATDADACAAIYAPHVRDGVASFEAEPPDAGEMARRIAAYSESHAWLVAERDGRVAGFAYGSPHRGERAAYRSTAEVTVYVNEAHRGAGVGKELYRALFDILRERGLRMALAGITLPNPASVRLHESLGFELVGVFENVGYKASAWRDVGWWQLDLNPSAPRPAGP